jgi:Rad3-related DNA helicase
MFKEEYIKNLFPFPPRDNQLEIVTKILTAFRNGKKHVVLSLPTGGGKSVIAYAVAKHFGEAYILTNQKVLQEQYKKDLDVPYILGRSNYICKKDATLTCEMGLCKRITENYCDDCPYLMDRAVARDNWITNMNYAYYLNITKARSLDKRNLLVMDESHVIENEMIKAGTIKITTGTLSAFGLDYLDLPKKKSTDWEKRIWLFEEFFPRLREQYLFLKNQIQQCEQWKFTKEIKKMISKMMAAERLVNIIAEIKKELADHQKVIIQADTDFIEFKVLYGYNLFAKYFENQAYKFLHMSATILNKMQYCKKLNLSEDEVEYLEYESDFPVENRLIHYTPVGSLAWKKKAQTIPKLIEKVKEILAAHPDEKGIIHTVNYELAEIIVDQLYGTNEGSRLIIPRGKNKQAILNSFYTSKNPYVLISPSLAEGLDLKDDLSRFCIICKMPYANIADKWVKTRLSLDATWYANFTAEQLVQMSGRSIRNKTDYAKTYILDEEFMRFAETNHFLLPDWWKKAVIDESASD